MRPITLAGLIALVMLGLFAGSAAGSQPTAGPAAPTDAPILVTTTLDELAPEGNCSLREAIQAANTRAAVDVCGGAPSFDVILVPSGTYTLTLTGPGEDTNATGDLDLTATVVLSSTGAAPIINGNGKDRVLDVGEGAKVRVLGLVISGGHAPDGGDAPAGPVPGEPGGGIRNAGTLTLVDVTVTGNSGGWGGTHNSGDGYATGGGGDGGGIANSGSLTLIRTRVTKNKPGTSGNSYIESAGKAGRGGGIANSGVLTVTWSTIAGNEALAGGFTSFPPSPIYPYRPVVPADGGVGGGVFNAGRLTVDHSQISGNDANGGSGTEDDRQSCGNGGAGGGIYNQGDLWVVNSTISANSAGPAVWGGGDCAMGGAGIFNVGALTVEHATITGNVLYLGFMRAGPQGRGGGINGSATLRSTILAGNALDNDEGPDCFGALTLAGYNLVQNEKGCTLSVQSGGNLVGQDAQLGGLADNGGPTLTHALGPTSPAIDAGSCTDANGGIVTTDQRGVDRPIGRTCDIGAFESSYTRGLRTYLPAIAR